MKFTSTFLVSLSTLIAALQGADAAPMEDKTAPGYHLGVSGIEFFDDLPMADRASRDV